MPLIPALGRKRQVNLCEFSASLVYKSSSRTVSAVTQRNPVLKKQNNNKKQTNKRKTQYGIPLCML